MKQQINLYQSAIFERKKPLTARSMFWLVLLSVGILTVLGFLGEWRLRMLSGQLEMLQRRQTGLEAKLAEFQASPDTAATSLLNGQIQHLREERDRRRRLLGALEDRPTAAVQGFSPYLTGLARQTVPGLWLRRIVLREGGREISLEGSAGRPEAVPHLVRQLAAEPAFTGVEFARFVLAREPETETANIEFRLETTAKENAP